MQKHYKLRLITNILDPEVIWAVSLNTALNAVMRSHRDSVFLTGTKKSPGQSQGSEATSRSHRRWGTLPTRCLTYTALDLFKCWHLKWRGLTSRGAHSPGHTVEATWDERCEFSTSSATQPSPEKCQRKKRKGSVTNITWKKGRMKQKRPSEFWRWIFSARGAVPVSVSWERSLNSSLSDVTCRVIDGAGCTLVFQSINSILFLLYDLPKGAVVGTQNNEYYHLGDIPDSHS